MLCSQGSPQNLNYQAVAYDDQGNHIKSKNKFKNILFGLENDSRKNHLHPNSRWSLIQWVCWLGRLVRIKNRVNMVWCHGIEKIFGWRWLSGTKERIILLRAMCCTKLPGRALCYPCWSCKTDWVQIKSSSSKSFAPPQPGVSRLVRIGQCKTDLSGNYSGLIPWPDFESYYDSE